MRRCFCALCAWAERCCRGFPVSRSLARVIGTLHAKAPRSAVSPIAQAKIASNARRSKDRSVCIPEFAGTVASDDRQPSGSFRTISITRRVAVRCLALQSHISIEQEVARDLLVDPRDPMVAGNSFMRCSYHVGYKRIPTWHRAALRDGARTCQMYYARWRETAGFSSDAIESSYVVNHYRLHAELQPSWCRETYCFVMARVTS